MADFQYGDVSIHYEVIGEGAPLLLLAPGALDSTIEMWPRVALDPIAAFSGNFQLIGMDQRNAGSSTGPFPIDDPWGAYARDQLALMDHLGIDRFQALGCCIGCSFALKIAELAPERLTGAVLEQPIGLTAENEQHWRDGRRAFQSRVVAARDDLNADDGEAFGFAMFEREDFVFSVPKASIASCDVPLLLLSGEDSSHPYEISLELVELAPNAEMIDPWRDTPERLASSIDRTRAFIADHAA